MASAWGRLTTEASAAASACFTASRLPKCCSSRRVVYAPTPGNFQQLRFAVANLSPLAVKRHREAVRLVAHQLNQVQHRRMPIEHDGIALLPVHVDDFFALGNRSQWLIHDTQRLQRIGCGMQLPNASVDQDQAGQRSSLPPAIASSAASLLRASRQNRPLQPLALMMNLR